MRRKISDDELSKVKDEVSTISDKIRLLRKEVKTCESIAERSVVMEYNLSQDNQPEQKSKRKGERKILRTTVVTQQNKSFDYP